jgi:hypothetical protein
MTLKKKKKKTPSLILKEPSCCIYISLIQKKQGPTLLKGTFSVKGLIMPFHLGSHMFATPLGLSSPESQCFNRI